MDWSGVDYLWIIVMFLSAVWTLILTAPIHCRGSIAEQVMQCYISPNLMKKQTHNWLVLVCMFIQTKKKKFLEKLLSILVNTHTQVIRHSTTYNQMCTDIIQGVYYKCAHHKIKSNNPLRGNDLCMCRMNHTPCPKALLQYRNNTRSYIITQYSQQRLRLGRNTLVCVLNYKEIHSIIMYIAVIISFSI